MSVAGARFAHSIIVLAVKSRLLLLQIILKATMTSTLTSFTGEETITVVVVERKCRRKLSTRKIAAKVVV